MVRTIKKSYNVLKERVLSHVEDFFILSGLIILIYATFLLNEIAGIYAIGAVLLGIGVYLTLPKRR